MSAIGPPVVWTVVWVAAAVATWRPRPPVRSLHPEGQRDHVRHEATREGRLRFGRRRRRSARTPDVLALAHWCEGVARAMRSGSTLAAATNEVSPPAAASIELDRVATCLLRGRPIEATTTASDPDLALVIGVLAACHEHGGAAAEPLDRAAAVLRGRAAETAERQTQSAQARLSARVMTVLPIAMLAMLLATSTSVRHVAVTPPGASAIVLGALLNVVGWRWLRRLVERASA